ncbi:hypothetical protein JXA85_06010 [Candidatus Woesearchaeota archaeon]|nr:hypothetical protein [Candidatus Woesearchaeota archaeon]
MAVDLTLKKVHEILSDVPPEKAFYLKSGKYFRNLHELLDALTFMEDDVFSHHVNSEKNDFNNWIRGAVNDEMLADRIGNETERARIVEIIENRIEELENVERAFSGERKKEAEPKEPARVEPPNSEVEKEISQAIEQVKEPKVRKKGCLGIFLTGLVAGIIIGMIGAKLLLEYVL